MSTTLEQGSRELEKITATPDSLSGSNHPLAKPGADGKIDFHGAVEIISDANGKTESKPLAQLGAGDHTVQLQNGRQFLMHVPENTGDKELPVMFVISGSAEPQWNIKDFAKESGMNQIADSADHKFIAVYPLAQKHFLGVYSKEAAWGWNAPGTLLDKQDLKHAGYSDTHYIKSIAELVPKLANVDATHKDWGAVGFSQGGLFLNSLVARCPNLFPSVGLIGTSMEKGYNYDIKPGNAKNVAIVNLYGDKETLPIYGNLKYDGEKVLAQLLRHTGHKNIVERLDPLAAINNFHQNPKLMDKVYGKDIYVATNDKVDVTKQELASPEKNSHKDSMVAYRGLDSNTNPRMLTEFSLVEAKHSYPGPERGARTNAQAKYTEFDASAEFAKLFNQYNDQIHAAHK